MRLAASGGETAAKYVKARQVLLHHATLRRSRWREELHDRSFAYVRRAFGWLAELWCLAELGGPFWWSEREGVCEKTAAVLEDVVKKLTALGREEQRGDSGVAEGNGKTRARPAEREKWSSSQELTFGEEEDYFGVVGEMGGLLGGGAGGTSAEGPHDLEEFDFNPVSGRDADREVLEQDGRAAFLARHLQNALKLKECLDGGYKGGGG